MASIVEKKRKGGTKYYIAYRIPAENKDPRQIWFPCENRKEASVLLGDVEAAEQAGREYSRVVAAQAYFPKTTTHGNMTVGELVDAYVASYGTKNWGASTLRNSRSVIRNYIKPFIGTVAVTAVTPRFIQEFYDDLPTHKAAQGNRKSPPPNISANTVKAVHKVLRPAFNVAQVWEEAIINPTLPVKLPKQTPYTRKQWAEEDVEAALMHCDGNERLRLAISLMFGCTLRSGEVSGLTWDCIDIEQTSIANGTACVRIEKIVRRLYREDITDTAEREIIRYFPSIMGNTKSVMVLKTPKTRSSIRKVFLPRYVSDLLREHQVAQEEQKRFLEKDYHDYGLVVAQPNGNPYDVKTLSNHFKRFITAQGLDPVDFYSLRHAGATAKLRASGNLKSVQGDMGHSSAEMLTKVYAAIVDEDRQENARNMEARVFRKVGQAGRNEPEKTRKIIRK